MSRARRHSGAVFFINFKSKPISVKIPSINALHRPEKRAGGHRLRSFLPVHRIIFYTVASCGWRKAAFILWTLAAAAPLLAQQKHVKVGERLFSFTTQDTLRLDPYSRSVQLEFGYAQARVLNAEAWNADRQRDRKPWRVDLVYSRYPQDTAKWITPYTRLMSRRVDSLVALDPRLGGPEIEWRLLAHGTCATDACARSLFHGAIVYYDALPSLIDDAVSYEGDVDWPRLIEYHMGKVRAVAAGRDTVADTLILSALNRHPEWGRLLIVLDWTSSMYPFGAQTLYWYGLQEAKGRVAGLVVFNDGDDLLKPDSPKPVGAAGGVYSAPPDDPERLFDKLEEVMAKGDGGDLQENDAEALLFALKNYPPESYDQLVLIADNGAGVRDAKLIPQINRPVHVILCRAKGRAIHPDYLTLAWRTGGSITTLEEQLDYGEQRPPAGSKLQIGGTRYRIDEKGFFRWTEPPKGW